MSQYPNVDKMIDALALATESSEQAKKTLTDIFQKTYSDADMRKMNDALKELVKNPDDLETYVDGEDDPDGGDGTIQSIEKKYNIPPGMIEDAINDFY